MTASDYSSRPVDGGSRADLPTSSGTPTGHAAVFCHLTSDTLNVWVTASSASRPRP
jgi:hypothetical protein